MDLDHSGPLAESVRRGRIFKKKEKGQLKKGDADAGTSNQSDRRTCPRRENPTGAPSRDWGPGGPPRQGKSELMMADQNKTEIENTGGKISMKSSGTIFGQTVKGIRKER